MSAAFGAFRKTLSCPRVLSVITLVALVASAAFTVMAASPRAPTSGSTYYVATTGNDSNPGAESQPWRTIQHCLDVVRPGDTCLIREGVYNESLRLSTSGSESARITIKSYKGESVTVNSGGSRTLSVSGRLGYYTIEGLSFLTSGAGGQTDGNLDFKGGVWGGETAKEGGNDGFILRDCYVRGTIKFYGHHNLVEGCEVDGMNGAWATGIFEQYGASHHNTYRANSIHGFSGRGIWSMSYTENILVENNWVFDCSTMGIDLDGASHPVRHGVVRDNTIHDIIGAQGVGILLENGFDCVIERNLIHDVGHEGIQVFNYGQGCGHAADGEYRDDHTSTVLKNNVIYNVYGGDKGAINGYSIRGIYVYGNTMYNVRGAGILLNEHCGWQVQDWAIKSNIFVDNDRTIRINGTATGLDVSNNVYYPADSVEHAGSNAVIADPRFVDAPNHDFHLQATSPAIDTGTVIAGLLDDFDGNPRPVGEGYDAGAYEYQGGQAVTPTPTQTLVPTSTRTATPTSTPTPSPTATSPPTATPTTASTATPTSSPTATPTVSPTATPTSTPTATSTSSPTATPTTSPTATPTSSPTATATSTPTAVPTATSTPTLSPNEVIIDDADARFSTSFSQDAWEEYTEVGGRHYGDSHYYNSQIGTGQDTGVWSFAVPKPGRYEVYAWWWEASWRPTDVPYTINHLGGSTTVRVNQQTNGGEWNLLGTVDFQDQGSVVVSDDASSGHDVVADAVRLVYLKPLPSATPTSTPTASQTSTSTATATSTPTVMPTVTCTPTPNPNEVIVDDADVGFSTSFSQDAWEEYTEVGGRHYGDSHYYNHKMGTGQDTAVWSFTVTVPKPGRYEVYAWWWEASWRPTDVPYTINHLGGSTTVRVNQQTNGGEWNPLGTFDFEDQGSVLVSDDASSGQDAVADAVRFVYVEPSPSATATSTPTANPTLTPTPSPTLTPTANPNEVIVDDGDVGFSTSFSQDAWEEYRDTGGRHYGDSHYYNHQIGTGQDTAVWSFAVPKPGRYKVYAWWWEGSWRPTDVAYTINHRRGSTTVRVNQQTNGGRWNFLGTFHFLRQGSVVVSDDASSGQDVAADAIRLVRRSGPPAKSR